MQRELRLTSSKRFLLIHQIGRGWANRLLVLKVISNDLNRSRFGFLTGKRIGNAVVRNKLRRRLREAVRVSSVKPGWDIVFIARKGSAKTDYHQLKGAAENLLMRAGLLSTSAFPPSAPPTSQDLPRQESDVANHAMEGSSDARSSNREAKE